MNLKTNALTHWKSTAAGIALAVGNVLLNGRSVHAVALAVVMAVFGAVVKDPA